MRQKIIDTINSSHNVSYGLLVIVIFIVAMKEPAKNKQSRQQTYTYLALGDSYTIGEQVKADENFPNQAVTLLKQKGFDFSSPAVVAKTGWTTDELQQAIHEAGLQPGYSFVTLLIGVNNQYRGRNTEDYIPEFESLLKQAIRFAGDDPGRVIVLSIPDWGVTPFAGDRDRKQIAGEIDEYNSANQQIASKYKVHYINITPGTREAGNDLSLLAEDGLHPSGKEYAKWAAGVAAIIEKSLRK